MSSPQKANTRPIKKIPHRQVIKGLVWITGASAGLGRALALHMAAKGWQVAASARSQDGLQKLEREGEGRIRAFALDIEDNEAVGQTLAQIREQMGQIDCAVLNAGSHRPVHAASLKAEDFKALSDLNLVGTANCLEHLLPQMMDNHQGQIAIVASVAGYRGLPTSAAYGMTKAGLINMAEALKPELDFYGVKMQLVCPGFIRTPLTDKNDFEMPDIMEPEDAAAALYRGLLSRKFEIIFPWKFAMQMKILRLLPANLAFAATRNLFRERLEKQQETSS